MLAALASAFMPSVAVAIMVAAMGAHACREAGMGGAASGGEFAPARAAGKTGMRRATGRGESTMGRAAGKACMGRTTGGKTAMGPAAAAEIGRASCRERV